MPFIFIEAQIIESIKNLISNLRNFINKVISDFLNVFAELIVSFL